MPIRDMRDNFGTRRNFCRHEKNVATILLSDEHTVVSRKFDSPFYLIRMLEHFFCKGYCFNL